MIRMRDLAALFLLLAPLALSGCEPGLSPAASTTPLTSSPQPAAGIRGTIQAGPQCPVEAAGQPCPPLPVSARIVVRNPAGREIATFTSDDQGRFTVALPPGEYLLESGDARLPLAEPSRVTVVPGRVTELRLVLDTGIR